MHKRSLVALIRSREGQALLEVPVTVLVVCIVGLVLMQLGVWCHAYLMVYAVSADVSRVVSTDADISGELLVSYANDRMQALGSGPAKREPGSLEVNVRGTSREPMEVTVSLSQRTLPLIRMISAGLVSETVVISATSRTQGTYRNVEGDARSAPYRYGNVTQ